MTTKYFPHSQKIARELSGHLDEWLKHQSRLVIGIEGYSGAKKTTIADMIARKNHQVTVVHLDDLLKTTAERIEMMKKSKDRSKVFELRWYRYNVLNDIVQKWRSARTKIYHVRVYDFDLRKYVTRNYDLTKRVLVVEGIFLFHPYHAISRNFTKKIYLAVNFKLGDERRSLREKKRWGKKYVSEDHPDSFVQPFKTTYRRYYKTYHPERLADLVVKT